MWFNAVLIVASASATLGGNVHTYIGRWVGRYGTNTLFLVKLSAVFNA